MDVAVTALQIALGTAALAALWRAVRGPDLVDRIVALDLVLLALAGAVAAHAARAGAETFVAVLIVVALAAFAGTVLVARFIEWRDTR
jgi:multicomponent Na+:H+ antiporter subunit F